MFNPIGLDRFTEWLSTIGLAVILQLLASGISFMVIIEARSRIYKVIGGLNIAVSVGSATDIVAHTTNWITPLDVVNIYNVYKAHVILGLFAIIVINYLFAVLVYQNRIDINTKINLFILTEIDFITYLLLIFLGYNH